MSDVTWLRHPVFYTYEISSDGRVRSVPHELIDSMGRRRRFPGKERKQVPSTGYPAVAISHEGLVLTMHVHVLVCTTFHGRAPSADHQVRHLDGTRTNNHADNLAWGTREENMQDALRHGVNNNARKTGCTNGHPYNFFDGIGRRCSVCRNEKMRESKQKRLVELLEDPEHPRHGKPYGYNDGCRCVPCQEAGTAYHRDWKRTATARKLNEPSTS